MNDEESSVGANDYKERAVRAFANIGIRLNPNELEGEPYYRTLTATIASIDGNNGARGVIDVTFEGLVNEEECVLQATREIYGRAFVAGITCVATIVENEVTEYSLRFADGKSSFVIELDPEGIVRSAYRESIEQNEFPKNLTPVLHKFPKFPELLKSFTTTSLDPNNPSTLFSPVGDDQKELVAGLELKKSI